MLSYDWTTKELEFYSRQGQNIPPFCTVSTPTQKQIFLFTRIKQSGRGT
jgi:hypothetical protein